MKSMVTNLANSECIVVKQKNPSYYMVINHKVHCGE